MRVENFLWKYNVPDFYEEVENNDNWLACKECGEKPRVWAFNNGRHARCCCGEMYSADKARAESVMSYHKRNPDDMSGYGHDDLRKAWNKWIETGEPQDQLPKGWW